MRSIPKDSDRCTYISSDGRRCCMIRGKSGVPFCRNHAKRHQENEEAARISDEIVGAEGALDTEEGIHKSLTNVFANLARKRISARDASVLGYVGQLMLISRPSLERTIKSMLPMLQLSFKVGEQNKDTNLKYSRDLLKNALLEQEVINGILAQSEAFSKMTPKDLLAILKFASMFTDKTFTPPAAKSAQATPPAAPPADAKNNGSPAPSAKEEKVPIG